MSDVADHGLAHAERVLHAPNLGLAALQQELDPTVPVTVRSRDREAHSPEGDAYVC